MTRRVWWSNLAVLFAAACSIRAATPTCPENINQFACLYHEWADLVWKNNNGKPGTVDAVEIATWQSVRHAWRGLEKTMNRIYGI